MLISNGFIVHFLISAAAAAAATYLKRPRRRCKHLGPSAPPNPPPPPLLEERGFHFDSMQPMNMYKRSNTIVLMAVGLLPARVGKQMVVTLPSSRCRERAPLLKMTTAINASIINRLAMSKH